MPPPVDPKSDPNRGITWHPSPSFPRKVLAFFVAFYHVFTVIWVCILGVPIPLLARIAAAVLPPALAAKVKALPTHEWNSWLYMASFGQWIFMADYILDNQGRMTYTVEGAQGQGKGASGDAKSPSTFPLGERGVLLLMNHPSEADPAWIFSMANRWGFLRHLSIAMKDELRHAPGFGWALLQAHCMFLERSGSRDLDVIEFHGRHFVQSNFPACVLIFAEGTDFKPSKLERSLVYAERLGWPTSFRNVLVPRTKGFASALQSMRPLLTAVYDITVAYEGPTTPTLGTYLSGTHPTRIHCDVHRYDIKDVPTDNDGVERWVIDRYLEKDERLEQFKRDQQFPATKLTPKPQWERSPFVWSASMFVLHAALTFYFMSCMYHGGWVRWYILFAWGVMIATDLSKPLRHLRGLYPEVDPAKRPRTLVDPERKVAYRAKKD